MRRLLRQLEHDLTGSLGLLDPNGFGQPFGRCRLHDRERRLIAEPNGQATRGHGFVVRCDRAREGLRVGHELR